MAGSRTEKHTAVYRNVKRCEFRSVSNGGIGFRSAFYEVNGKLITE